MGHDVKGHGVIQGHMVTKLMNIDLLPFFDMFSTCAQSDDRFGRCPYFLLMSTGHTSSRINLIFCMEVYYGIVKKPISFLMWVESSLPW